MLNYYRISDNSNKKLRFEHATKKHCLENFFKEFDPAETIICADNVTNETHDWLWQYNPLHVWRTSSGISSGFMGIIDAIVKINNPDEVVYICEDDYLHLPNSKKVLLEGLELADYVSLYDHADKYMTVEQGGNPLIDSDGCEVTKVFHTDSVHWKLTNSTTYTFASTVKVFQEDYDVFLKSATITGVSPDFQTFLDLYAKGRSLATPLPGYSTHCEPRWASPLTDWSNV